MSDDSKLAKPYSVNGPVDAYEFLAPPCGDSKQTNPKDMVGVRKAPMSTVPAPVMCAKHPDRRANAHGICHICYVTNRYATMPEVRAKADARATAWRHANPERARAIKEKSRAKTCPVKKRDAMYRRKYGITVDYYEQMLAEQGGLCAICHQHPPKDKLLHVDHCHKSGVVRGLLCHQCNWYLGKVDSIPGLLSRLTEYVKDNP